MDNLKNLIFNSDRRKIKEISENSMIERDFIKTKVFGWIKKSDADWLNKQLEMINFGKTVEDLTGMPSYPEVTEEVRGGKSVKREVLKVYPFVFQYFNMVKAREANGKQLVQSKFI